MLFLLHDYRCWYKLILNNNSNQTNSSMNIKHNYFENIKQDRDKGVVLW